MPWSLGIVSQKNPEKGGHVFQVKGRLFMSL